MNMGAYSYIAPRLGTAMKAVNRGNVDDIKYVGRAPSAATATGFYQVHTKEQTGIVQTAVQPDPISLSVWATSFMEINVLSEVDVIIIIDGWIMMQVLLSFSFSHAMAYVQEKECRG